MIRNFVAMSFSIAGILCFIATQDRFAFLEPRLGRFLGIAFLMISGLVWAFGGWMNGNREASAKHESY